MKPNAINFCISLTTFFLLLSGDVAATEYKNRLSVLPIENPVGWAAPYDPGDLVTTLLKRSIAEKNNFYLAPPPSFPNQGKPKKSKQIEKAGTLPSSPAQINHPSQFILKGRVLNFTAGKPPSRAQLILNIGNAMKQKAEMEVELQLINHHLKKTVEKKVFKIASSAGTVPFDLDAAEVDLNSAKFQKSSIGKALGHLAQQVNEFLMTALHPLPLEGEVISVNAEKKEIIINVGQVHGIDFGDFFNVYSVTLQYKDPFTQLDLGNKFWRRAVVRVKDVQEGFSIAAIVAGEGIEKGELVRSRKTNTVRFVRDSP
ncbi:MAG: hypothetical protein NPINA01_12310 [Nitrospinaceae bacterium]|nr:MAG: hypothetical protein NPINA01_12310 [Nitrospinaceae bacterium]